MGRDLHDSLSASKELQLAEALADSCTARVEAQCAGALVRARPRAKADRSRLRAAQSRLSAL